MADKIRDTPFAPFTRDLPPFVGAVLARLEKAGFEAYLVGGAVRDLLSGRTPTDWDVATSARPEDVCRLFPRHKDVGRRFGTIIVQTDQGQVEVTTFRGEGGYHDKRHPDVVHFGASLAEDLARRDFTINALAWSPASGILDPYGGLADLKARFLRTVGDPDERFREDALRVLRAARFAATLCLRVEQGAKRAMRENAAELGTVAPERIGPELDKLLLAPSRGLRYGLRLLCATGALKVILPEVASTYGVTQNIHHRYSVWHHTVLVVAGVPCDPALRWAALLHDVGKVPTRSIGKDGRVHFYGHEAESAKLAAAILGRTAHPRRFIEKVSRLIQNHMFPISPEVTDAAIRRLIIREGSNDMPLLLALKQADIRAKGRRSEADSRAQSPDEADLARYKARVERLLCDGEKAVPTRRDLAVTGEDVMQAYGIGAGPAVGRTLERLYQAVLDNPALNTPESLRALLSTWPPPR